VTVLRLDKLFVAVDVFRSCYRNSILFVCGCTFCVQKRGDYLLVGVYGDSVINQIPVRDKQHGVPTLMSLPERALSVLGCRYVSDIVFDAPYYISLDMIHSLKINEVIWFHTNSNNNISSGSNQKNEDRFQHAVQAGILVRIESPNRFQFANVIDRILDNKCYFQDKYTSKAQNEKDFYQSKYSETTKSS
jgi:ethanolamine-phosphate cytidylyltransferase